MDIKIVSEWFTIMKKKKKSDSKTYHLGWAFCHRPMNVGYRIMEPKCKQSVRDLHHIEGDILRITT